MTKQEAHSLIIRYLAEIFWALWIITVASNIELTGINDPVVLAEIGILCAVGFWALYRYKKQTSPALPMKQWSCAAAYYAVTIGMLYIHNSSWTRLAVLLILGAYIALQEKINK